MQKVHQSNVLDLEQRPVTSLLWKYFVPAFTGVILNSLYNVVARIFIGHGVGALALSGLSAVFPIMIIMMAFGMLIGMGAGVRISIALGKKDYALADRVLGNAFVLTVIVSAIIMLIGFWVKDPILHFFGVGAETYKYATEYLDIILLGTVFNVVGFSLNNLIRSEGNARTAMFSMMISAGTNLLLDPLLIFVFDMGVAGAAWSTVISQALLTIWVIWHFRSKRSIVKLHARHFKLDGKIIWYIISVGFAPFSMQLASSVVQGVFNMQLAKFEGDLAIGAMGIINSVIIFLVMSVIAINMAAQPIIGFNYGARNYSRVKQTLVLCIKAATAICVVGFITVQLFPGFMIKIFNNNSPGLLEIGTQGIRLILLALPFVGFQIIVGNFFQSTGKAGIAALLSMMRQVIMLLPFLFVFPNFWGIKGVWYSAPVADTLSALIVSYFLWHEIKWLNVHIRYANRHASVS
ncbi:MAG: MATE family efflux transporter [Breznakibacter sp.]